MVRAFHDAGLEVILDVVYNHTAEGNEKGPTLVVQGHRQFLLLSQPCPTKRATISTTPAPGTRSTPRIRACCKWCSTRCAIGRARWRSTASASISARSSGREPHGFSQRSGFFDAIGQDPALSRLKLIGEPWDIGPGGYQVGGFPPGWSEWNDKFRDGVRDYWRGEHEVTRELAARVTGSGDVYDLRGRRPWASVNFVTAHDGFTLNDLVSYNERHNEANGEDNRDGHSDNRSHNLGCEGPTDDEGIRATRERQKRNYLATLLFSHGAPMILAGDEFGRTQTATTTPTRRTMRSPG